ncbi:hypothetical protein MMC16_005564 [Acarospora aff. strigata]|nr:hypothetical protein [Acarospora aff. strigata]
MKPPLSSNLAATGSVEVVVLGYVQGLTASALGGWQGGGEGTLFAWQKFHLPDGRNAAFLGCRVDFWGDIAGNLVRALHHVNSAKYVLYFRHTGEPQPQHEPNKWLAIGDTKWLEKNKALYDFVDPEIGHMAKSALDLNIQYGYLYIISDNPAHKYTHDLLNERSSTVVEDRKARLMEIDEVLRSFFLAWEKY